MGLIQANEPLSVVDTSWLIAGEKPKMRHFNASISRGELKNWGHENGLEGDINQKWESGEVIYRKQRVNMTDSDMLRLTRPLFLKYLRVKFK